MPYDPDRLLAYEQVLAIPPRTVATDRLRPTQPFLVIERLLQLRDGAPQEGPDPYVHAVELGEQLYVHNGHHRWALALLSGQRTIDARIQPGRRRCSCRRYLDDGRPNRNADGSVKEVTVACDVHHVMADGQPASLHEVLCPCGNFADDRDCTVYLDEDGNPEHVCNGTGCAEILVRDCAFTLAPPGHWAAHRREADAGSGG